MPFRPAEGAVAKAVVNRERRLRHDDGTGSGGEVNSASGERHYLRENKLCSMVWDGYGATPEGARGKPVELWWQDEVRIGQQGTLARVRAARGARSPGDGLSVPLPDPMPTAMRVE